MSMLIHFLPDDIEIEAEVGESFLNVAARAGIDIPTGCLMGSCHACVVDTDEFGEICTCITAVPPSYKTLTVYLSNDPTW